MRKVLFLIEKSFFSDPPSGGGYDKMTKKQIKVKVNEELYEDFKEDVRRVYGKIHGNMSQAIEDALNVYIRVGLDPNYQPPQDSPDTCGPEGGSSSHPKNQDQIDEFYKDFKARFYGFSRVHTKELTNFIMSETSARSETTIKKWRNRLRNKGLIYYTNDGWWSIKSADDHKQSTFQQATFSPIDEIYSHLTLGKRVSFRYIQNITNGNEKATKDLIASMEKEGMLEFLGPGFWKVIDPDPGEMESVDNSVLTDEY